jgi:hypothetical protein
MRRVDSLRFHCEMPLGIKLSFVGLSILRSLGFRVLGKSQNNLNHVGQTLFLNSRMLFQNKSFVSPGGREIYLICVVICFYNLMNAPSEFCSFSW